MQSDLQGIPATMLIPLWARAVETMRPRPIIEDPKARQIISILDFDFSMFEGSWLSQLGVSIRSMLLDRAALAFMLDNPDAVVVNLGAGLDTRYERLQAHDGVHLWYDVDLPESLRMRRRFFKEDDHNRFIARSIFDYAWMDEVRRDGRPMLLIAEGLFMYFSEQKLRPLFAGIAERFPGAEMLFEMLAPILVGKAKWHDSVHKADGTASFEWGLLDSRQMETWDPRIQYLTEWNYYDYEIRRWKWFGIIGRLPFIGPRFSNRIVHLRFSDARWA